jgi:hypothetical protein
MGINFPASPSVGQKYPASPVGGLPTYTWDGEKWTTTTSTIAGTSYVLKSGDTMAGHLSLLTAPAAANAVRKDYVDAAIAAIVTVPSCTVVFTVLTIAPSGWLLFADQTIGNAGSGSTFANVEALNVFTALYNNFADAVCPVATSAGGATTRAAQGTAANAWSVGLCRMAMPLTLGRALAVAGSGSGLTARSQGIYLGAETHTLLAAEGPNMTVSVTSLSVGGTCSVTSIGGSCSVSSLSVGGSCGVDVSGGCSVNVSGGSWINAGYFVTSVSGGTGGVGGGGYSQAITSINYGMDGAGYGGFSGSGSGSFSGSGGGWISGSGTGSGSISGTGSGSISGSGTGAGATTGGGGAHNNMPPTSFLNAMIKL